MEVASPGQGANGHTLSSTAASIIDPNVVVQHLVDLLEITLGASTEDLEATGSLLSDSKKLDTVQRCTRFASESQVALYVQKDIEKGSVAIDTKQQNLNGHGSTGKAQRRHCSALTKLHVQNLRSITSMHSHPRSPSPPQLSRLLLS